MCIKDIPLLRWFGKRIETALFHVFAPIGGVYSPERSEDLRMEVGFFLAISVLIMLVMILYLSHHHFRFDDQDFVWQSSGALTESYWFHCSSFQTFYIEVPLQNMDFYNLGKQREVGSIKRTEASSCPCKNLMLQYIFGIILCCFVLTFYQLSKNHIFKSLLWIIENIEIWNFCLLAAMVN